MDDLDVTTGTLPAGFQFGAYVIGGCIGQGGMARIYRAEHRVLRKPVALKVMESVLLERPDGRPRFLREGQAAAAVKHPNVVDITDVGVWQGRPYLVMELLEGEDLEQYLSRHKPLAEHDVARLMIPVIAGLATAHASGVVHRDLKPSNVFLSRGPVGEIVPKVLDFGISKLANSVRTLDPSSTPVGELMGSPMYMSPEAVRGARDLTAQSDQYSLGVVLYECVTGRPPFYGDSLLSVLEAVAHGKFESPRRYRPELSAVLENAIMRAMSRDPSDRFANVRDLGRALCEAADHRTRLLWTPSFGLRDLPLSRSTASLGPSPIRTGSPLTSSVNRRPRHWPGWQVALLGLVAISVFVIGVVSYWRASEHPYSEKANPQALQAAAALAPPAEPLPAPRNPELTVGRGPAVEAPGSVGPSEPAEGMIREPRIRREPVSAAATASVASRPRSTRNRAVASDVPAAPRNSRPAVTAPEAAEPEEPEGAELDEIEFLVRPSPTAPRAAPVLGANQSPILD